MVGICTVLYYYTITISAFYFELYLKVNLSLSYLNVLFDKKKFIVLYNYLIIEMFRFWKDLKSTQPARPKPKKRKLGNPINEISPKKCKGNNNEENDPKQRHLLCSNNYESESDQLKQR